MAKDMASYFLEQGEPLLPKPKPKNYTKTLDLLNSEAAVNTLSPKTYTNLVGQFSRKAYDNKEISATDYYDIVMPLFGETGEMVTRKIEEYEDMDNYAKGGRVNFNEGTDPEITKLKEKIIKLMDEENLTFEEAYREAREDD